MKRKNLLNFERDFRKVIRERSIKFKNYQLAKKKIIQIIS